MLIGGKEGGLVGVVFLFGGDEIRREEKGCEEVGWCIGSMVEM